VSVREKRGESERERGMMKLIQSFQEVLVQRTGGRVCAFMRERTREGTGERRLLKRENEKELEKDIVRRREGVRD